MKHIISKHRSQSMPDTRPKQSKCFTKLTLFPRSSFILHTRANVCSACCDGTACLLKNVFNKLSPITAFTRVIQEALHSNEGRSTNATPISSSLIPGVLWTLFSTCCTPSETQTMCCSFISAIFSRFPNFTSRLFQYKKSSNANEGV